MQLARSAYSTLSPMNRVLYEETDNTSALVWQPTALHDKTMQKWGFDEQQNIDFSVRGVGEREEVESLTGSL